MTQQIFAVQLLYVRYCVRHGGCNRKQDRQGVSVLRSLRRSWEIDRLQNVSYLHGTMKEMKKAALAVTYFRKDPRQVSMGRCDLS